jgi:preprotein translocase subunit SecA
MFGILKKIFGTEQTRKIKKYSKLVSKINQIEKKLQNLSDDDLIKKTSEFKKRYKKGESLDSLLPEAYAVVKNTCRRLFGTQIHVSGYDQLWDMIPYDVQLVGAISMHNGCISEMQTGEGKTLTASMPLYLNALTENPVHLITVNDYLAKRDCEWIGVIFKKLGLSVSPLTNDVPTEKRKEVYKSDIVYGTASEFGFDYLRDNSMASSKEDQVQRGFYYAIIDEVDSILIDEARTPLIISGPCSESKQMYDELKGRVSQLVKMQRNICNKLATDAKSALQQLGVYAQRDEQITTKLSKEDKEKEHLAYQNLWLVNKGTPRNKILKRMKENPDMRAKLDECETYFYSDQNKEEKAQVLSVLYIIVDERASEYELTDKGINEWCNFSNNEKGTHDFLMLDMGYEYAEIDNDTSLEEKDKIQKKIEIREEDSKRKERSHNLRQLFRAHLLMEKDVDYIIQENKIVIIDENTGRPQPGRRFSDGLHQSIEAKEGVHIQGETQTYATITLQNFFRMYDKLAGMTGTAITEAGEFREIYKLDVLEIPTYCNCKRNDMDDEIYMTEREKYIAILKEIQEKNSSGQPILIGTESVEISEKLSRILKQNNLFHTVLNAKNHESEAEIIADAGKKGAITLATNMAGRGTDIKLKDEVKDVGGLHVIGTTRHHSRRIDRQLRGRSGRLGDPGSSKFFVSFEDSLMRLFASPRLTSMLQRFRPPEGEPISAKVLNKSIETAQKRIEQRNSSMRKHTLEYDDVMNKQRKEIYSFRNEILNSDDIISIAKDIVSNICSSTINTYFSQKDADGLWNHEGLRDWLMTNYPVTFEKDVFLSEYLTIDQLEQTVAEKIFSVFDKKLEYQGQIIMHLSRGKILEDKIKNVLNDVIRDLMIRKIDQLWQEHLLEIDHLRNDVGLRAVAQKDPLLEFKHEAFMLFHSFYENLSLEISKDLFLFELVPPPQRSLSDSLSNLQMHQEQSFFPQPENAQNHLDNVSTNHPEQTKKKLEPITSVKKAKRNDNCPCGSGKKYKKCCGQKELV